MTTKRLELQNRFYDRIRSGTAGQAVERIAEGGFEALKGRKHCLIITFKRDGSAVPTPVWFGLDAEGRLYFRTGANVAKVKRIRHNPHVLVAPCSVRGKPLGPSAEGRARVLSPAEKPHAEATIQSNYGLGRRLYERTADGVGADEAYIEVMPASAAGS